MSIGANIQLYIGILLGERGMRGVQLSVTPSTPRKKKKLGTHFAWRLIRVIYLFELLA